MKYALYLLYFVFIRCLLLHRLDVQVSYFILYRIRWFFQVLLNVRQFQVGTK